MEICSGFYKTKKLFKFVCRIACWKIFCGSTIILFTNSNFVLSPLSQALTKTNLVQPDFTKAVVIMIICLRLSKFKSTIYN